MDKLKLALCVIALVGVYIILFAVGVPFMVAVLITTIGFIIFATTLVIMLIMLALSLLPFFMAWFKIKRVWRG